MTDTLPMPASPAAEKAVLGAVMLDNQALYEIQTLLAPDDFHLEAHRRIYRRMVELGSNGKGIDLVTLTEWLGAQGELNAVGGVAYISDLTDGLPKKVNLGHHAKIIKETSRKRQIIGACQRGIDAAFDAGVTAEASMGQVQEEMLGILADATKPQAAAVAEFSPDAFHHLEIMASRTGETVGLPTGISSLNKNTTGIREGELWIIGGRPAQGKTSLGVQMAAASASQGTPVAVFSLEMSREQLLHRLWAGEGPVPASRLRKPEYMNAADWTNLAETAGRVAQWPLYIDDTGSLHVRELLARARLYIRRYGVKLIVLDFLQLVETSHREVRDRVSAVANALRVLAKTEQVAAVALSQLARPQGRNTDLNSRPTMQQIKESGDVEAAAHVVVLCYRPFDPQTGKFSGEDEIIVAKQREGEPGAEAMFYHPGKLKFVERT